MVVRTNLRELRDDISRTINKKKPRPTVVVIGCGPGGMFFLHAIATRRRVMEEAGNIEGLEKLPHVTVFERSAGPGGVWKSDRDFSDGDERFEGKDARPNMYEALWTNGPKENFEFFDYTFDEHFGGKHLPTFMPREQVLEYFLARVTRNNPHIFENVHFDTSVLSVKYEDDISKFTVVTRCNKTGITKDAKFDKCVYAAGENGKPRIPEDIDAMLNEGGFLGKRMHSSNLGNFEQDVKGKRVMMIGDQYSAEDLALQAIKLGVERVYIYSRGGSGIASYMNAWPFDKVELIYSKIPTGVIHGGKGICFKETEYNYEKQKYESVANGKLFEIRDISTIIYCTGYSYHLEMIDEELCRPLKTPNEECLDLPKDWKMKPNVMTEMLGEVTPASRIRSYWINLGLYRCLLISKPSMMFLGAPNTGAPLLEVDVNAWLLLAYITGDVEIPNPEMMRQQNKADCIHAINFPYLRIWMDSCYERACSECSELDTNHWSNKYLYHPTLAMRMKADNFGFRCLARDMCNSSYPVDIGTFEKLNKKGKQLENNDDICWINRLSVEDGSLETFRDCDPNEIRSIFTGITPVKLRKLWLKLEESDYDDLLKNYRGEFKERPCMTQHEFKNKKLHYSRLKTSGSETVSTL